MKQPPQKTYNKIDFVVKAPRFRIVFSYMDNKNISFIREYFLRLLHLTPCKPEQIAQYFGFNEHETDIALKDLLQNKWIEWKDDGAVTLSAEGMRFFHPDHPSPQVPTLREYSGTYCMELLDNNFLMSKSHDNKRQQAIELKIDAKTQSECKEIAHKVFLNRFHQLLEDEIITINEKDITLYKIDIIEPIGTPDYFRFTQNFELLPETGEVVERDELSAFSHQENIQQSITHHIADFANQDNLRELKISMEQLNDEDTIKVLFGGKFDFIEFTKVHQKFEKENGLYFLGQSYHQDNLFSEIKQIFKKLKKSSVKKKLCWLAPSDAYWGKQLAIHGRLQYFIDEQEKSDYQFRLYLPMPNERIAKEKNEWKNAFIGISEKILYGFQEGFFNGNTEIIYLENEFVVVCYHAKLNNYPVTLPIGFMTKDKFEVNYIANLVSGYLKSPLNERNNLNKTKDLGLINIM